MVRHRKHSISLTNALNQGKPGVLDGVKKGSLGGLALTNSIDLCILVYRVR